MTTSFVQSVSLKCASFVKTNNLQEDLQWKKLSKNCFIEDDKCHFQKDISELTLGTAVISLSFKSFEI